MTKFGARLLYIYIFIYIFIYYAFSDEIVVRTIHTYGWWERTNQLPPL